MSITMKQIRINALAAELAKDLKMPEDLSAQLTKITVEVALKAEM